MAEGTSAGVKEEEGKKRRFSAFINHNYSNSHNKRISATPTRVLLVGRSNSGKSSIISMLLNRDVRPGMNGRGIFVSDPSLLQDIAADAATPDITNPDTTAYTATTTTSITPIDMVPTTEISPSKAMQVEIGSPMENEAYELYSTNDYGTTSSEFGNTLSEFGATPGEFSTTPIELGALEFEPTPIDIDSTPIETDPPLNAAITPDLNKTEDSPSKESSPKTPIKSINRGRMLYHSDKYIITDIDGFDEGGSVDIVGSVLEHRKWLEESQQGFNIVLMVIKAQQLTDTDRKIFALCNALLHDLRDMIHLAVTGCDANPRWIQENELELRRVYGTSKAVGLAFPTAEGGLLECIFEEMRKESLVVLEEYISRHSGVIPRVPIRVVGRGGSVGSSVKKPERQRHSSFSR